MSVFLSILWNFLKKPVVIVSIVLIIVLIIGSIQIAVLKKKVENRDEDIETLVQDKEKLELVISTQEKFLKKMEESIKISQQALDADKVTENHYHEKVIENNNVIEKYMENPEDKKMRQEFFDYINDKWMSFDGLIKTE